MSNSCSRLVNFQRGCTLDIRAVFSEFCSWVSGSACQSGECEPLPSPHSLPRSNKADAAFVACRHQRWELCARTSSSRCRARLFACDALLGSYDDGIRRARARASACLQVDDPSAKHLCVYGSQFCTLRHCLESACLSYVLMVPVANWLTRGSRVELCPKLQHRHGARCPKSCSGSTSSASVIRTLDSHSVATLHVGSSMFVDCLVCPQRGFVLEFVPSSKMESQRRQCVGIGMVRVVMPYVAGMTTCTLLSLCRRAAGLHPECHKRKVGLLQLCFRVPRANQVSVPRSCSLPR